MILQVERRNKEHTQRVGTEDFFTVVIAICFEVTLCIVLTWCKLMRTIQIQMFLRLPNYFFVRMQHKAVGVASLAEGAAVPLMQCSLCW